MKDHTLETPAVPATTTLFNFQGHAFRAHLDDSGAIWMIAQDVFHALDLRNGRSSLALLDDDEKGVVTVDTLGGRQTVATINESGMYALILRSRKETAKIFRKWVTGTVLPTLRKDGMYVVGEEEMLKMSSDELEAHLAPLRAQVATLMDAKLQRIQKERHAEEKQARRDAHQWLRRH